MSSQPKTIATPISRGLAPSPRHSIRTATFKRLKRRAVIWRRAGRSIWRSASCTSCVIPRPKPLRWPVRWPTAQGPRALPATGPARPVGSSPTRSIRRSTGRSRSSRSSSRPRRRATALWRVPHGEELYVDALTNATTTAMTPAEIHQMGLDQVKDISAQLDSILKANGLTNGSVGERLTALNQRPDQLYADSDAGRADLIRSLNAGIADMKGRLPRYFNAPPDAPLEIRRVPVGNPGRRFQRLLSARRARWLAARHLFHQPQGCRRLAEIQPAQSHLS